MPTESSLWLLSSGWVCWPLLCHPFCIYERCLDSNPESCRCKQAGAIYVYTDNKIKWNFPHIYMGAVAKSYKRQGFKIYEEMRKYIVIYEEAVSHIWLCNCSLLDFWGQFCFLFYQCTNLSTHLPIFNFWLIFSCIYWGMKNKENWPATEEGTIRRV